jgi:hypothetical protein
MQATLRDLLLPATLSTGYSGIEELGSDL